MDVANIPRRTQLLVLLGILHLGCAAIFGRHPRAFAVVALLRRSFMIGSGYLSLYGVDVMLQISLFYLVWMDSADRGSASTTSAVSTRWLQIHLCPIYLDAGVAKASGVQWWTGEALWRRALMQPQFAVFDIAFLAEVPVLMTIATVLGMARSW